MSLITVRSREPYCPEFLSTLRAAEGVVYARCVNPVYDILPIEEPDMPFTTAKEMFAYAAEKKIPVWQAALDYERAISGLGDKKLMSFAENLWDLTVRAAVLGAQSILGQICDPIDGAGHVPCFLRNITAVPTAIACANAALGGCETLTSLDEMAETLLRVGIKLKTLGLNNMGVCYYRMQCDNKAACAGCGK